MSFAFVNKKVAELDVVGLAYHVGPETISCCTIRANGHLQHEHLCDVGEVLVSIDAVRDGLARTTDVARGRVPALRRFIESDGRQLLPESVKRRPPDIVVMIPHGLLHSVPLHLIHTDDGTPLAAQAGVTYVSSMSEFVLCAIRNSLRRQLLAQGHVALQLEEAALPPELVIYCGDVLGRDEEGFQLIKSAVIAGAKPHFVFEAERRADVKALIDTWPDARTRKSERAPRPSSSDPAQVPGSVRLTLVETPMDESRRPRALVIIAHGFVDPVNHERSGVLVGPTQHATWDGGGDRYISASSPDGSTLFQLDVPLSLPPPGWNVPRSAETVTIDDLRSGACELGRFPLVALFGCSAGWARQVRADLPSSFGQTFVSMGSANVVAPQWDAHSGASARWAESFFHAWSILRWPAALSSCFATRELLRDGTAVEHCGPFALRGDWV